MKTDVPKAQEFKGHTTPTATRLEATEASAVGFSVPALDKTTGNEDSAGFWEIMPQTHVLAVADGMGGCPGGAGASAIAIESVAARLRQDRDPKALRTGILDAFEAANQALLDQGIGAGTTLVVVEVHQGRARAYHAGDSGALIIGQRGRIRMDTISHSPVGYAVASGFLPQDEIHHHEERHLLSNCLGSREMRVEVGAPVQMAPRDTLLLATDGVLDNIQRTDLIELIRSGSLLMRAGKMIDRVAAAMSGRDDELPAHPDDATALLFRRTRLREEIL